MIFSDEARERASRIKLMAFDVDGVFTDNSLYYSDEGVEIKVFNARDGYGTHMLRQAGLQVAVITGRRTRCVELRMENLGIKLLRAGGADAKTHVPETPDSRWRLFVNTYLVTALNPKGIVFFVAFLPQFIHPGVNAAQQLLVLACTFVAMAIINSTLYAYFAASARTLLASPGAQRKFTRASGSLLSIAGIWVLLARRPA